MYTQLSKEATERKSAAEKELMATMGLSAAQMASVQAIEALGVTTGNALILTKAGVTAQNLAQLASVTGLTAAEAGN
jgi:copper homeostasis protein CutC